MEVHGVGANNVYSIDILEIEEPCTHAVQFAGLCSMCGNDMTQYGLPQCSPGKIL